jgi:hypothetical protein
MIALSWSRLSDFMECPRKFHLKYITKSFPDEKEKSIHLIKGEQLHKQMEQYVVAKRGDGVMPLGFSPEVRNALPYADKLFSVYNEVFPEAQVAFTQDWQTIDWFGGPQVAWRAIWDVIGLRPNRCFLGDWKSGKVYPYGDTFGQLHLSALMAHMKWQELAIVDCAYVYLEHSKVITVKVAKEPGHTYPDGRPVPAVAEVRTYFENWFDKVQMEKAFEPTPNDNCKWCAATRAQCKFSRKL